MGNCKSGPEEAGPRTSPPQALLRDSPPRGYKETSSLAASGMPLVTIMPEGGDVVSPTPITGDTHHHHNSNNPAASISFCYPESPELGPRNDTTAFSNGSFANNSSAIPLITSDVLRHFNPLPEEEKPMSLPETPIPSVSPVPLTAPAPEVHIPTAGGAPEEVGGAPPPLTKSSTQEFSETHSMSARELSSIHQWLMATSSTGGTDDEDLTQAAAA